MTPPDATPPDATLPDVTLPDVTGHRVAPRWWRPDQTLRGRLTVGLVAVLLVACAVLGVATGLFLRTFLLGRLDDQLATAGGRFSSSLKKGPLTPGGFDGDADNAVPGQSVGTLGVRLAGGRVTDAAVVGEDGSNRRLTLTASDTRLLRELPPGGPVTSAALTGLGDYRLRAVAGRDGDIQVTGLPLAPVTATLAELAAVEAALFAVVVVAGGLATAVVVRRTLRPLRRVADTALDVSELPLTSPDAVLPARIAPPRPTSEVDQVSVALDHMLDHIRAALAVRDGTEARLRQFVADASHELRTPLAIVRVNAEYAARQSPVQPLPAPVGAALTRITAAAERMGALVADLLLLARLDAGRPLAHEPVDLTRLVLEAVIDARSAGPTHRWQLDLPDEPLTTQGDPDRLRQVLANLLTNAFAHTPADTTVTTSLRAVPAGVEISVADDGPGIPADRHADLFERFTRGDTSRSREHGSTGLGLAIAHSIVAAHHGSLRVARSLDGGACFIVRLPD